MSLLIASPERWEHGTPVFRRDFRTETTNTMCAERVGVGDDNNLYYPLILRAR